MSTGLEAFMPKNFDEIEEVKKRLRHCEEEWLEKKPGRDNVTYMSHNTIRQILDNAVKGVTFWDFNIIEQWKEEIWAQPKGGGQPYFDGYVYHVKGSMFIPGIGRREQYGSKVAIGGKTNQDSAYKAAASNCFNKCASLFGVGAEIYDKIKVEGEQDPAEAYNQQQFQNNQQQPNNMNYQQPQQQQNMYQQQQGFQQQQNYQQNYYQNEAQQMSPYDPQFSDPNYNQNQQQQGQQAQQTQQQNAFGAPNTNFNQGQQVSNQQQGTQASPVGQTLEQSMLEVDRALYNNVPIDTPFTQGKVEMNPNEAEQKQPATATNYEAQPVSYGAPTDSNTQPEEKAPETKPEPQPQPEPAPEQNGTNPWQEQGVIQELQQYAAHKKRLNAETDEQMIAYLRDYFKDEKADFNFLQPDNLPGFNKYLESIAV